MTNHLDKADLEIEIYRYDPSANDDLYEMTKAWLLSQDVDDICRTTKLRRDYVTKVIDALQLPSVHQLNQLGLINGIRLKTLEKIFNLARGSVMNNPYALTGQQSLLPSS